MKKIRTVTDLLQEIHNTRYEDVSNDIKEYNITHGPSIGDMHEDIVSDLSEKALFEGMDLRVVRGFISNSDKKVSSEIDCMIVYGEGKNLGGNRYVYPINQVIAVIEVKTTLDSTKIQNCLDKFKELSIFFVSRDNERLISENKKGKSHMASEAFRFMTKKDRNSGNLTKIDHLIQKVTFADSVLPLRVIYSFKGYETDKGFASSYSKKVIEPLKNDILSPKTQKEFTQHLLSLPNLIINGHKSIVKNNGLPINGYDPQKGIWDFYSIHENNALYNFVNLIWFRLLRENRIFNKYPFLADEPITREAPIIKITRHDEPIDHFRFTPYDLDKFETKKHYSIKKISLTEYCIIDELERNQKDKFLYHMDPVRFMNGLNVREKKVQKFISITLPELAKKLDFNNGNYDDVISLLRKCEHLEVTNEKITLVSTSLTMLLVDDGIFAGDNRNGNLSIWNSLLEKQNQKPKTNIA